MKAKHLIGLLALLSLTACEKPQPTSEEPIKAAPLSVVKTYTCNPITGFFGNKPTYVYLYHSTASISFDTADFVGPYRRLFCFPSEVHLFQSTYDTIHHLNLPRGDYKLIIDNIYSFISAGEEQDYDTARWYHLHNVSVSDTAGFVIVDTFFYREWSLYSE